MKEQEKKEATERQRQKEEQLLSHLVGDYEISHFPPREFNDFLYIYEFQKYFANQSDKHIAFRGYLKDLEQTDNNLFVEFSYGISAKIAFRLQITDMHATNFLNKKRTNPIDRVLGQLFYGPDYLVVAKVKNISKIRKYEIAGTPLAEDEVETDIKTPTKFIVKGVLIDAVEIPRQKE